MLNEKKTVLYMDNFKSLVKISIKTIYFNNRNSFKKKTLDVYKEMIEEIKKSRKSNWNICSCFFWFQQCLMSCFNGLSGLPILCSNTSIDLSYTNWFMLAFGYYYFMWICKNINTSKCLLEREINLSDNILKQGRKSWSIHTYILEYID